MYIYKALSVYCVCVCVFHITIQLFAASFRSTRFVSPISLKRFRWKEALLRLKVELFFSNLHPAEDMAATSITSLTLLLEVFADTSEYITASICLAVFTPWKIHTNLGSQCILKNKNWRRRKAPHMGNFPFVWPWPFRWKRLWYHMWHIGLYRYNFCASVRNISFF